MDMENIDTSRITLQTTLKPDFELNVCGLSCPLPLLHLKLAMQKMSCGQTIRVLATDPAAAIDFGVFAEDAGHALTKSECDGGITCFLVRKIK